MSFNKKTTIQQTGLGDDQYTGLQTGQKQIGEQLEEGFTGARDRFDTVDSNLSGLSTGISNTGTAINTGFTSLNDYLADQFKASQTNQSQLATNQKTGFTDLNTLNQDRFNSLQGDVSGVQTSVDTGFSDTATANQNIQTAIGTGFQDTSKNFSDLNTRLTDDFTAAQDTMSGGFADVGKGLTDLDTSTQNRLDTVQGNVLTGQSILDQGITGMSAAQDTYYDDLSGRQMEIQQGQDGFQSTFDDYVQRYSDDTTLANQTRADIQTGLVNATDRIRTDMGNFAQAAATGDAALSGQLSDAERANRDALGNLNTVVQGGFTGQSTEAQQAQENLATRLGNLGSMVDTVGSTVDASTREQYSSLMASFDDSGDLIRSSIDAQGNTIQRSMDDQGNLVVSRFDQAGSQIDQVGLNVNDMLSRAEQYQQSLSGQISGVQEGIMSAQSEIGQGFNNTSNTLDLATRDIAALASQQGDIDGNMRSQFSQLSSAFDENGRLIQNSIMDNGNTLGRAIDDNGNLLLRSFDSTGRTIGNQVININRALSDLNDLPFQAGTNVSMGNLSPAMQGEVPTSGFASPFTTTR
jgi:hypothetical protein